MPRPVGYIKELPKLIIPEDKVLQSNSLKVRLSEFGSLYTQHEVLMEHPTIFNRVQRQPAYSAIARELNTIPSVIKQWEKTLRSYVSLRMARLNDSEGCSVPDWFREVALAIKSQEEDLLPQVSGGECSRAGELVLALCGAARRRGSLCSALTYMDVKRALRHAAHTSQLHNAWVRIQRVCMRALWASARVGDVTGRGDVTGAPAPRPARLVADLVLLHSDVTTQRLLAPDSAASLEESAALYLLWRLVLQHRVEHVPPGDLQGLARCWTRVWKDYRDSGRVASIIVLQRRWHELKLQARHILLSYWRFLKYVQTQIHTQNVPLDEVKPETGQELTKLDDDIRPHVWNSDSIKEQMDSSSQIVSNDDVLSAQADLLSTQDVPNKDMSNAPFISSSDLATTQVMSNNDGLIAQIMPNITNVTSLHPTPLHLDILDKCPTLATTSIMSWEQMLADEMIVCNPISDDKDDSDMDCSDSSENEKKRKWRERRKRDLFAGLDEMDDISLRPPKRAYTDQTDIHIDKTYNIDSDDSDTEPALQIVEEEETTLNIVINPKETNDIGTKIKSKSNRITIELELIENNPEATDSVNDDKDEDMQDTEIDKDGFEMDTSSVVNMAPNKNKLDSDIEMKTLNLTKTPNINKNDQYINTGIPNADNVSPYNNKIDKDIEMMTPKVNNTSPTGNNINKDIKMKMPNVVPNTKAEIATKVQSDSIDTNLIDETMQIVSEVTENVKVEVDIEETKIVNQNHTILPQTLETASPNNVSDIQKEPDKVHNGSIVNLLNNIKPSSVQAKILFESDSETEHLPSINDNKDAIQLAIKQEKAGNVRDRLKFSDELDEDEVISDVKKVKVERVGESSFRPGIVVDVDMDEPESADIVRKLLLDARVEVQRMDPDTFWKIYKSGPLNIRDIKHIDSSKVIPPIDTNTSNLEDFETKFKTDASQQTLLSYDPKDTLSENDEENQIQSDLEVDNENQVENVLHNDIPTHYMLYPINVVTNYNINIENQFRTSSVIVPNLLLYPNMTPYYYNTTTLQNTFQSNIIPNLIIYPEYATTTNTINPIQYDISPKTTIYPENLVTEIENQEENQFQSTIKSINDKLIHDDSSSSSEFNMDFEETNINDTNTLIDKTAILISSDEEDLQDGQKRFGEEKRSRVAKRVELPDIDEVRRVNSSILTAQVAPISAQVPPISAQVPPISAEDAPISAEVAPVSAPIAPEVCSIASKQAPSDSSRMLSEPSDVLTVGSDDEMPVGEVEELPSVEEVKQIIEDLTKRMFTSVCCSARRHRYENDASQLKGLPAIHLHTHVSGECTCCCRHLCSPVASTDLRADLIALRNHIMDFVKVNPIKNMDFNADTKPRAKPKTKRSKQISSRSTSTSSVNYISSDNENNKLTNTTYKDDDILKEKSNQTKEVSQKTNERCLKTKDSGNRTKESCLKTKNSGVKNKDTSTKTKESGIKTKESCAKTKDIGIKTKKSSTKTNEGSAKTKDSSIKIKYSGIKTKESSTKTKQSGIKMKDFTKIGNKSNESFNKTKDSFIKTKDTAIKTKDSSKPDNCHCQVDNKITGNNPLSKAAIAISKNSSKTKGDKTKKGSIANKCDCITEKKPPKRAKKTTKDVTQAQVTKGDYEEWIRQRNINSFYFKPKTQGSNEKMGSSALSLGTTDEKTQGPASKTAKNTDSDYAEWMRQKNINSFYFKKKPKAPINSSGAISIERVQINTPSNVVKTLLKITPKTDDQSNSSSYKVNDLAEEVVEKAKNLNQFNSDQAKTLAVIVPEDVNNPLSTPNVNNCPETAAETVQTIPNNLQNTSSILNKIIAVREMGMAAIFTQEHLSQIKGIPKIAPKHNFTIHKSTLKDNRSLVKVTPGNTGVAAHYTDKPQAGPHTQYLVVDGTKKPISPDDQTVTKKEQVIIKRHGIKPKNTQHSNVKILVDKDNNMLGRNSETNQIENQVKVVSPDANRCVVIKRAIVKFPDTKDDVNKGQSTSAPIVLSDDDE